MAAAADMNRSLIPRHQQALSTLAETQQAWPRLHSCKGGQHSLGCCCSKTKGAQHDHLNSPEADEEQHSWLETRLVLFPSGFELLRTLPPTSCTALGTIACLRRRAPVLGFLDCSLSASRANSTSSSARGGICIGRSSAQPQI
eukprot:19700-Heterococcus_DN1.PRE.1